MRVPLPAFEADARELVTTRLALRFLWTGAAVCLIGAVASTMLPFRISAGARTLMVVAQMAMALACVLFTRLVPVLAPRRLVLAAAWIGVAAATLVALSLHGVRSLELGYLPLIVCVVAVLVGTAAAFALAVASAAVFGALALAEALGWIAGPSALAATPLAHPLVANGLLLLAGFTVGAIVLRLSNESYRLAQEREQRFRRLLAIAADHYIELDAQLRLVRAADATTHQASALFAPQMMRPLADIAGGGADPAVQARALQDLRAQRPFAALRCELPAADGRVVQLEFSGQPRSGDDGRFAGYWGVARDLTAQFAAQAALKRTESMLATVFATSPDCLVLSELVSGRLLMANQAALDLFGYTREQAIGRTAAELRLWPRPEERAALVAQLRAHGRVSGMRVTLRHRSGRESALLLSAAVAQVDGVETLVFNARDLADDDRRRDELAAARDAAEAASRAKTAFLANMSHEIRTPLNGLLGLARLAMREDIGQAQHREYVEHILDTALGLAATLSDTLDVSKIEAGKLEIDSAPFNLHEALQAVYQNERGLAQAKGLTLALNVESGLPARVRGDATRVRQIVANYVSNAIKFTDQGGVRIDAAPLHGDVVRLAVTDTGIGIDAAAQRRLFTPFTQADQSTTRRFGGTGLGLSICRELARLMGGSAGVHSTPGMGSVFWADLPLPAAPADAPAPALAKAGELAVLRGARVLVAEDNAVNMLITLAMLEQLGVHTAQAEDGEAALQTVATAAAAGQPFDAVLMDVQMPRVSGHQAARELRARYGDRTPPIIALTAAALVSEREQALAAGMSDFLTKPVDADRLRSVLARHIGAAR
ncbi:MAG: response regulator [Rubrivivax sp.]|nr:response regulator [Rubrivivax sp.]